MYIFHDVILSKKVIENTDEFNSVPPSNVALLRSNTIGDNCFVEIN
jgi:hypothetical protein